jgi:adenosylcobinamide-GDP ribazoletransferase
MRGLLTALGLFTIAPVRGSTELDRASARHALLWLPLVGAGLGALAGLPVAAVRDARPVAGFVAAVIAIAVLALLTRGLHLDGLADTADGLGSRAPAERALEIMRQSDIGPFGVVTLVLVLLIDVAAVATLGHGTWGPLAALTLAAATARVAVVQAAQVGVAAARPGGFGALVTSSVPVPAVVVETLLLLGAGAGLGAAVGANPLVWAAVPAAAMLLAGLFRVHTTRRFGGVTGDVFGAVLELATALTLMGLALFG